MEEMMTGSELVTTQDGDYVPSFAVPLQVAAERLDQFKEFIKSQMDEGEDYGTIPGTVKPTLLKPGAEKLCNIFGFAPRFEEVDKVEHWDDPGFFYYSYKCSLVNKRTGQVEAECTASCNSKEDKYRWRLREKECPQCGQPAIIKSKFEDAGWYCFPKKGGCGAKFDDGDPQIEEQEVGRVENSDPYSLVNTIQKMAQKRALIGAVLIATRASGIFTQDIEDMPKEAIGATPEKPKKKGKSKIHDDIITKYWQYAKDHDVKGSAEQLLEEEDGDFPKAFERLKELCGERS
jgi:hypothetical protein